jgi:hypothetical protein
MSRGVSEVRLPRRAAPPSDEQALEDQVAAQLSAEASRRDLAGALARLPAARPPRPGAGARRAAGVALPRGRLRALEQAGVAVRIGRNLHMDAATLRRLERRIIDLCRRDGATTIAGVRDELGTSRRYAQALLEHLDAEKLTLRRGDQHMLRGRN